MDWHHLLKNTPNYTLVKHFKLIQMAVITIINTVRKTFIQLYTCIIQEKKWENVL